MGSVAEIQELLLYLQDKVPDKESNRYAQKFVNETDRWSSANNLLESVQKLRIAAMKVGDKEKECQYAFEEACAKTLYNITGPDNPYDPDSPYWVIKNALILTKVIGASVDKVVNIVASD